MPEVSKEQVKDFIKNMTLLDAAALVKELEEELGVSAAAPIAVAAAAGPAAAVAEEKLSLTLFSRKRVKRRSRLSRSFASLPV